MGLIFASLIFLLFDVTVTSYEIDILSDFLGWIFMLAATFKMSSIIKYSGYAKAAQIVMLVMSVPYEILPIFSNTASSVGSVVYAIAKLLAMTFVLFCFLAVKDRIKDKTFFNAAAKLWFVFLALEVMYFIYAGLIEPMLSESVALAITQVVVITLLFTQVLFLIFFRKAQKSVDLK